MPDVGTPLPRSTYSPSHTSSDQWQSFEIKMRYRRAERCLLRAETALEAGLEADARTALDEARSLNPSIPDLETLHARIAQRRAVVAAASRRAQATRASAAATVLLAGALATFAFWPDRPAVTQSTATTPPVAHTPTSSAEPATVPRAEAPPPSETPVPKSEAVAAADLQPAADLKAASTTGATPAPAPPLSDPETRALDPDTERIATSTPPATAPANTPPLPVVDNVEPPLKMPPVNVPQPTTIDAVAARELPAPGTVDRLSSGLPSTAAPAPSAPAAPPEPERVEVPEEPKIRGVLARFEAAYSSLDASAAQAVWPTVDAGALANAFNNLESQQVSLGRCSVSISGSVAHATCNGTSSWTPKVGAGRRSAARRWTFNLESSNGSWQIVRAEAR